MNMWEIEEVAHGAISHGDFESLVSLTDKLMAERENTTEYYECLVRDITSMLKYFTEVEIYDRLIDRHDPDTLEYAIDDAKLEVRDK